VDVFQILDTYGIPLTLVTVFGWFIWKQNTYIQNELDENLDKSFSELRQIVLKLIGELKKTQLEVAKIRGYVEGIEDILSRLTNGLRKKNDN
jgi:hypothetical protein